MDAGVPRHVQRAAEQLAASTSGMPLAALVGPDGSGRTEILDDLADTFSERSVAARRVAGRRSDRQVAFAALAPLIGDAPTDQRGARSALADALGGEPTVLVVDDAHLLDDASIDALCALVDERSAEIGVVITTIPAAPGRDDALTAAIARRGTVVRIEPADEIDVAERAERILDDPPDGQLVELLIARACGHARLTDRLVAAWRDEGGVEHGAVVADLDPTPRAVVESIGATTTELTPAARAALTALAIGPALDDALLTSLAGAAPDAAPVMWHELRAAGLLVHEHEEALPIVADAVALHVDAATRRDLHRQIADLLLARGAPPAQVADHLVAAEARGPEAARVLVEAGEAALAEAPEVAVDLLTRAVDAGVDPALLAGPRAEAAALAGDEDSAIALADLAIGGTPESTARAEVVLAGVLARRGLWARAARSYASIHDHPRLPEWAVRSLGSVADAALGRAHGDDRAPHPDAAPGAIAADVADLLGRAATAAASGDAVRARRAAGEAADLVESAGAAVVLPETPHVLGALVALATGDSEDAERLAARALDAGVGGPAAGPRHRLVAGFAAMRAGRWDRAKQALHASAGRNTTRDELWRTALAAAIARRTGDVAQLVASWDAAAAPLAAVHGDLFLVLPLAELVVVAARLGRRDAIEAREAELDVVLDELGRPGLWARPLAWARVEAAVAGDAADPVALERAAEELAAAAAAHERLAGLDAAALAWQHVLAGRADGLDDGVTALERAGLVWEASRLVGQAAIRAADPGETRTLLGRARELKGTLPVLDESGSPTGTVLSSREQEVAACVVDGLTHKEIGAMLFISPKTVEHHVARIRQKLGATSRAELLAGLRTTLARA